MKSISLWAYAAVSLIVVNVHGHCKFSREDGERFGTKTDSGTDIFQQLGTGAVKGKVYEHVRKNTNHNSPVVGMC
jgi:hypothetical protein